ncbi:MAG: NAD(P)H-hydrate dehydratase [Streptococcaceae bacterium]|jgi:NAD(P)H-hydrate epimerase|nr:NAD(P)H-hydrate dehydratase [Streptococcaceae bacterium]
MYISTKQMYQMEKQSGIEPVILMENAGRKVFEGIVALIKKDATILVLTGNGNNGGDGVVIAHHLLKHGYKALLCLVDEPKSPLTIEKLRKFKLDFPQSIVTYHENVHFDFDVLVDCIFGIGFYGQASVHHQKIFAKFNTSKALKISVDIPSGLSGDLAYFTQAIKADYTFVIQYLKLSAGLTPSRLNYGQIKIVDIQIPYPEITLYINNKINFPKRPPNSHKGDFGKGLLIAGSNNMPGAACIASGAAVRSGLGLLQVATTNEVQKIIASHLLEATYQITPTGKDGQIASIENIDLTIPDVIVIGPGLGRGAHDYLSAFIPIKKPIIIDADGLYHLSKTLQWLEKRQSQTVVLTPHEMEMARLLGVEVEIVTQNRLEIARDFAMKYKVYLILKGAKTIITDPLGNQLVNDTGNEVLAKGGTGDMLMGMLLGLLAQKNAPIFETIATAVYLHGKTGDLYKKIYGQSYTASLNDLLNLIPSAFSSL